MNAEADFRWHLGNRQRLLGQISALLGEQKPQDDAGPEFKLDPPARIDSLCATFSLGRAARHILLLAAASDLGVEPRLNPPTIKEAALRIGDTFDTAICPQSALRRWRLIEVDGNGSFAQRSIRLDERVLHHLLGIDYVDPRLDGLVETITRGDPVSADEASLAGRLIRLWSTGKQVWPVLQIAGPDRRALRDIAFAVAKAHGFLLLSINVGDIPRNAFERQALARLCDRELALSGGALLVEGDARDEEARTAAAFVDELIGPTMVAGREALAILRSPRVRADMPETTMADRLDLWKAEHSISSKLDPEHLAHIADRFSLDRTGIRTVSDIVGAHANEGEAVDFGTVWNACRLQARRGLDDLAERIVSQAGWNDLVLPDDQLRQLKEIAAHVRRSHQVHHQWGWAQRGGSGLGITALFAGPSGTGKTMAAEVLANELDIDLYRIDLSQIVSKYIGETEKNLRRIFEAAEHGGAMLVFEEADSMFGKRSDVKDSHDRYANLEVSYLLQRMESYKGLAILTTNLKGALDIAFMRRLRFVIAFPFPDQAQRAEIWRRVFPKQTPMGDCNPAQMARLSIAGGAIRTIAVNAAFMAAEDGSPVELRHLSAAARREYAKLEKPITAAEFGGLL